MEESSLYDNLIKATDNLKDISFSRYGVITKVDNKLCNVKELDSDLEHLNVNVLNKFDLKAGDKVLLGFVDNDLYNPIILGVVNRAINTGGGGSSGVVMVGSFRINNAGHLIVTLPTGTLNPYHINENGHLIYSTNPQI